MAILVGPIKFQGTIGDVCFRQTKKGCEAGLKGGPDRQQYERSAAFAGSRKMSNEMGYCAKIASRVRHMVFTETGSRDKTMYHRLFILARRILACDMVSEKGKRQICEGLQKEEGKAYIQAFEGAGLELERMLLDAEKDVMLTWPWLLPYKEQVINIKEESKIIKRSHEVRRAKRRASALQLLLGIERSFGTSKKNLKKNYATSG